jgi:hypothetical protein
MHTTKAYEQLKTQLHSFLSSTPDEGDQLYALACGSQDRSLRFGGKENLLPLPGIEPQLGLPARSLVTRQTTLYLLHWKA